MSERDSVRYWKGLEERDSPSEFLTAAANEFPEPLPVSPEQLGRRGFLKAAGFTLGGAVLTGCQRAPVEKAIPYLVKPEEITPGRPSFYASTCGGCSAACGLLVKNRDGRPIKLEGNPDHPLSGGSLCAAGQASILGLYDSRRLKQPRHQGKPASWQEVDAAIRNELDGIQQSGGKVRFLTDTINSPTELATIEAFLSRFADGRHIAYDPLSCSAILDAHQQTHGLRLLPRFRFDKAEVIVSLDADFLGTWISPVEYTRGYRLGKMLEMHPPRFSEHIQFESRLSLTGSKADRRIRVAPRELSLLVSHLAALVADMASAPFPTTGMEEAPVPAQQLQQIAQQLWAAKGRSLVICGSQDVATQVLCNFINDLLENYGSTIDVERPSYQRRGSDRDLQELLRELDEGEVDALFIAGVNPVYDLPGGRQITERLAGVPLLVSFAERLDESAELAQYVCPDHHYLESWGDREPARGVVSLLQPCLHPLGDTRALIETLATWMGTPKPAYDLLRETWQARVFPRQSSQPSFQSFWDHALHTGVVELDEPSEPSAGPFDRSAVKPILAAKRFEENEYELVLYPKVGMLDGRHAYNPWLQELPDPVTKVTWDNYACLSPAAASRLDVRDGDVVRLEVAVRADTASNPIELPVVVQPGQHDQVVAVALGYGSKTTERFAAMGPQWLEARPSVGESGRVGTNAAPFLHFTDDALHYVAAPVNVHRTGRRHSLACTQTHHTITVPEHLAPRGAERRPVIEETTLAAHQEDVSSGHHPHTEEHEDLWPPDHLYPGHHWGMAIDLSACTGCSACTVACQVENNVPVVGKDEVRRRRDMHWIRIDRYYSGDPADPQVAHQPMLCQHCDNAPCETVCPVLATVHSEEGLNQQIYNRCVGTRYCANNCPYKVRRFNWFDYAHQDQLENLVLNPDVAVRSRGVMEKCSFCVQRVQEAKIEAKRRGQPLCDGEIQTACQQSCPANAIFFGDLNDPQSRVSLTLQSPRRFEVLAEINVRPSIGYLKVVRRQSAGEEGERHG